MFVMCCVVQLQVQFLSAVTNRHAAPAQLCSVLLRNGWMVSASNSFKFTDGAQINS